MEVWPVTLPQRFSASDFQYTFAKNTIRSDMDNGPAKVRRVTIANVANISGSMVMKSAQLADFETFYSQTIAEALPFEFPNPLDDGATTAVLRFTAPPSLVQWKPGAWRVSLQLEVLPS